MSLFSSILDSMNDAGVNEPLIQEVQFMVSHSQLHFLGNIGMTFCHPAAIRNDSINYVGTHTLHHRPPIASTWHRNSRSSATNGTMPRKVSLTGPQLD